MPSCVHQPDQPGNPPPSDDNIVEPLEPPESVVSLSPNLTQIIFALDASEYLVAVDDYSVYPPEAAMLPRVGNYMDPDLEALAATDPDLVLIVEVDEGTGDLLAGLGLAYISYGNNTIDEILGSITDLGWLMARTSEVEIITSDWNSTLNDVRTALEGVEPREVALVIGRNPGRLQDIYVAGSGSYLGEIIELAGGVNVFGDQPMMWPQIGAESMVGADPDIIIDSTLSKGASDEQFEALREDWDELPGLRALRNDRIIIPTEGWFQIPGAHLDSILMLFAHWIHPEIFPDEVNDPNL